MQSNLNIHLTSIQNLFSEYGIRNISMDDIAQNLHISKKTIYKQYANKEELVKDIYLKDYYHFKASLQSLDRENIDVIEKTIKLFNVAILKIFSLKRLVQFDLEKYYPELLNSLVELHKDSIRKKYIGILLEGITDKYFHEDIKPYSLAHIFSFLIESSVLEQIKKHNDGFVIEVDDIFDYHFRSICNPIGLHTWEDLKAIDLVSEQSKIMHSS